MKLSATLAEGQSKLKKAEDTSDLSQTEIYRGKKRKIEEPPVFTLDNFGIYSICLTSHKLCNFCEDLKLLIFLTFRKKSR